MPEKIKILFICHGNICRSPMAELIMKDMVEKAGCSEYFEIASAATSTEALGCRVYSPARKILADHGISCEGKTARQVSPSDYEKYDWLLCADDYNIRNLRDIIPQDPEYKIKRMLDFSDRPGNISDPWYTRDFETAYNDIAQACQSIIQHFIKTTKE